MIIPFVVYDRETGVVLYRGADQSGAAGQVGTLPPTQAAMDVPVEALSTIPLDLGPIRAVMVAQVDMTAERTRMLFLTPGEGQALTYSYKADEARRWTADGSVETPFLTAEAAARGMTVADLAAEVLTAIAAWTTIGASIEAARMKAKAEIIASDSLPALAAAGGVDWAAVIAPAIAPAPASDTTEAPSPPPNTPPPPEGDATADTAPQSA